MIGDLNERLLPGTGEAPLNDQDWVSLRAGEYPADELDMLYYPSQRRVPAPLRAFIDHLREETR